MLLPPEGGRPPRTPRRYRKSESSYAARPIPNPRDDLLGELTLAPVEMHRFNGEAGALCHDAAAFRAPGTLGRMAGNVADIHVPETLGVADGLGAFQR